MDIDDAFERFRDIRNRLPPEDDKPIVDNEACTRLHLIDPILRDVLGWAWDWEAVVVEAPGGEGVDALRGREGRVDYVVRDEDGVCHLVVEAKKRENDIVRRPDRTVGCEELKLTGPVLKASCWPVVSRQMPPYLGRYMPRVGVVTTGEQWVGFLHRLLPEGQRLAESKAVVFRSLDDIEKDFELFFECFGLLGSQKRSMLRRLAPWASRGLVRAVDARRIVAPGAERPLDYQGRREFYDDLRRAMDAAFHPARQDREALQACFVESRESRDTTARLQRIANELGEALHDAAHDYPPAAEAEVDGAVGSAGAMGSIGTGFLARLLGERSAGKSVFLQRFFDLTLGPKRSQVVLLWVDAEQISPFDAAVANRLILGQLKEELFGDAGPTWSQLREVYRREWTQRLRLLGVEEGSATLEMRQAFIAFVLETEATDSQQAVRRYAEFTTKNRRRLVCLVADNLDHLEHPEEVLAWVLASHLSIYSLTTVAMEDATVWRLRRASRDQLADHAPEQFWLHRPKVREVVKNRCEYLRTVLAQAPAASSKARTTVGRRGQYQWSVEAEHLVRAVGAVLLGNDETAQWIGQLCNFDLREVLEVCQQIVLSPHLRTDELLLAQVAEQGVSRYRVLRALIAPKSEQFQALPTDRVTNIFGYWIGSDFAPMLPARMLVYLRSEEDAGRNRREPFAGFVSIFELTGLFEKVAGVPRAAGLATLRHLSVMQLVEPFNPADPRLEDTDSRVKITPRGRLHLEWAVGEPTYVRLMAEVEPIVSPADFRDLRQRWRVFLRDIREPEAHRREREFVGAYLSYLLDLASSVSGIREDTDLEPVREFEKQLQAAYPRPAASAET